MANTTTVTIPDLGGASEAEVIEILVVPGDSVAVEDSLLTLEGDKATMDVPSSAEGKVVEILVKVGDQLKPGDAVCTVQAAGSEEAASAEEIAAPEATIEVEEAIAKPTVEPAAATTTKSPVDNSAVYAGRQCVA